MSTPIKREDIRKGDRIRSVREYTAKADHPELPNPNAADLTYELIERPVVLPTEPGVYLGNRLPQDSGPYLLNDEGEWLASGVVVGPAFIRLYAGDLTLLRPVAEVAAEVLAEWLPTLVQIKTDIAPSGGCNTSDIRRARRALDDLIEKSDTN